MLFYNIAFAAKGVSDEKPTPTRGGKSRRRYIDHDLSLTPKSGALGLLKDLPYGLIASITGQYVERTPRAPELFSLGVHEAAGTFDVGDPNLKIEKARTVEIGLRKPKGQFRFEATAYYTRFQDFIYRRLTGATCDEDFTACWCRRLARHRRVDRIPA